jgi:catechol 2,3-dioxygenase-like lactoylglutathione lyase family enzyme
MMKPAKDSLDIGVLVSDINKSLEFYRDWLGLSFIGERPVWYGVIHRLRFGHSDFKLVLPNDKLEKGAIGLERQLGYRYVTFEVQNLSEICATLKEKGVKFYIEEREPMPGVRFAMVADPDGNTVEFLQRS